MSVDVTTPRAGKLLVHAELGKLSADCPFLGPIGSFYCNAQFGPFIDGEPVRGSYRSAGVAHTHDIVDQRVAPIDLLIPNVPAGAHNVSFALGAPMTGQNLTEFATFNFGTADRLPRRIIVTAIAD